MRASISIIAAGFLALSILLPGTAQAEEIATFNMDNPEGPSLQVATDTQNKAEGEASLKITTYSKWPATVPIATVNAPGVENARVTYSAKVKSALGAEGTAYLEMWCIFADGQYFSRGLDKPIKGEADWTELSTPFFLKEGQTPQKIQLNLVITGIGSVWIDDIHLSAGPAN